MFMSSIFKAFHQNVISSLIQIVFWKVRTEYVKMWKCIVLGIFFCVCLLANQHMMIHITAGELWDLDLTNSEVTNLKDNRSATQLLN